MTLAAGGVQGKAERRWAQRLVTAWLLCAVVDGTWAVVLTRVYGRSVTGLFEWIATTAFGPTVLDGATSAAFLGLAMHFAVALFWSAVFLALTLGSARLNQVMATSVGKVAVAVVYGPFIWVVMSAGIIPALTGQGLTVTPRWWIQFAGHIVFVGLPIVWGIGAGRFEQERIA